MTQDLLASWLDGYVPAAIQRDGVPGAVVVVVKDGHILVKKGYGFADLSEHSPVDPDLSLFRVASLSKLFTATAVMQLVEKGELDLDRDINGYLDFHIPDRTGGPITLRHLLTHTAGFEDHWQDQFVLDPTLLHPLADHLRTHIPARIFAVGTIPAYSNYGMALAGYIVQRKSGEMFDSYVEHHIFKALDMSSSTFHQPLPSELWPRMATGYTDRKQPHRPQLFSESPAGALATTGSDMGNFMIAFLQDGNFQDRPVLQPRTVALMQAETHRFFSPLPAIGFSFFTDDRNGHRIVGHDGALEAFFSSLNLILDRNVGIFVAVNGAGSNGSGQAFVDELYEDFVDRYFPSDAPSLTEMPTVSTALHDGELMAGSYEPTRRNESSFLSAVRLYLEFEVKLQDDGTLVSSEFQDRAGKPKIWREIAPWVWRESGGAERLVAVVKNGRVESFAVGDTAQYNPFQAVPFWRSAAWLLPAMISALAVLAVIVLFWPIDSMIRKHYGRASRLPVRLLKFRRITWVLMLFELNLFTAWVVRIKTLSMDIAEASSHGAIILLLQIAGLCSFPVAAVGLCHLWMTWRSTDAWSARVSSAAIASSLVLLSGIVFVFHFASVNALY